MKLKGFEIVIVIMTIIIFGVSVFIAFRSTIDLFYDKYEGYVAFTEVEDDRYIVLVIKDITREEIETYSDAAELDYIAQQDARDYGTRGNYFSINQRDFKKLKKGQKVEIYYKEQAAADIWGAAIKASKVKIIEE
ncbi:DUF3221 domain-containing protein [Bacillus sp. ISL-45]|uniref:DUF3221 domain-containing protein n=1 Tax=Bacillus sp. ISL-45 TaxID=2819128 RepID=UPI001BE78100|nr:DUF3221 domain-containing protein [Bacillus sp. ISL-45]MBT2661692.1 DUF3221 domain-containing protein [Bacillus sp. ISL-45]